MKKISWITEDWALDTDINIVPHLINLGIFKIDWYVLTKVGKDIPQSNNYTILRIPYRLRDIRNMYNYIRLFRIMKIRNADIIYSSAMGIPFYYPMLITYKRSKQPLIHAAHNVIPYNVWPLSMRLTVKLLFSVNKQFQFFSRFTYDWFQKRYKNKTTFYAPMVVKDYGNKIENNYNFDPDKVNLLFFGNVAENKRLDLLIEAVKSLPSQIKGKVHLYICGNCKKDKQKYINQINSCKNISVFFKRIPDEDIPELFLKSSFLILPYQDVAQSGPHMIAYNYNLPVIASDLEGFKERIIDDINGFIFKKGNKEDLIRTITKAVNMEAKDYQLMKSNLKDYVNKNFSVNAVANKYVKFLNSL